MTAWKFTIRTSPGALVAAEYECPVHGRFAVDVPRGEDGDPPGDALCPRQGLELANAADARHFEAHAACGSRSLFVMSFRGTAKVRKVEAVRGRDQKPEFATWTNTQGIEDGQDIDDWKADRAKVWEREREREAMEMAREL